MEQKDRGASPELPGIPPALLPDLDDPDWRHVVAPAPQRAGA
jgi:hypothetical protein